MIICFEKTIKKENRAQFKLKLETVFMVSSGHLQKLSKIRSDLAAISYGNKYNYNK